VSLNLNILMRSATQVGSCSIRAGVNMGDRFSSPPVSHGYLNPLLLNPVGPQAAVVLAFMFSASWRLTVVTFVLIPMVLLISKVRGGGLYSKFEARLLVNRTQSTTSSHDFQTLNNNNQPTTLPHSGLRRLLPQAIQKGPGRPGRRQRGRGGDPLVDVNGPRPRGPGGSRIQALFGFHHRNAYLLCITLHHFTLAQ
jgi:hypothetical protein